MKIKTLLLLLMTISFIPALSMAYADPTSTLRVIVAETEFTDDDGNVIVVPTLTSSPGVLENLLFAIPDNPLGSIFPDDVETYGGDVYAAEAGLGILHFELTPSGSVINVNQIADASAIPSPIGLDISSSGILYVASKSTSTIYEIDLTTAPTFTPNQIIQFTGSESPQDVVLDESSNTLYVLNNAASGSRGIIAIDLSDNSDSTIFAGDLNTSIQLEIIEGTSPPEFYMTTFSGVFRIIGGTTTQVDDSSGSIELCGPAGISIEQFSTTSFDIYFSDSCYENPVDGDDTGAVFRLDSDLPFPQVPILEHLGSALSSPAGIALLTVVPGPDGDLGVSKIADKTSVSIGEDVEYTITATNFGPASVTGIQVDDTLPLAMDFVSVSGNKFFGGVPTPIGAECSGTPGNQDVNCTLTGTFATNDYAEIVVTATVLPGAVDPLNNKVTIFGLSPLNDINPNNNSFELPITLTSTAEITLTKTADQTSVTAGQTDPLLYDILIANGPTDITDVMITDTLPAGLTFDAFIPTNAPCTHNAGIIECNFGNLLNLESTGVTISVLVDASATGSTLENTVDLTCNECSPTSATETTNLLRDADLTLTKTADQTSVVAGQSTPLTYTLNIDNQGPSSATNVVLTDSIPSGLTITSVSPNPECGNTGNSVTCNFAQILPGITTITIVTNVDADASDGVLTNSASVTSTEDSGPNDASVSVPISTEADLVLDKQGPSSVSPGQTFVYTFDITNNGPSTSKDIQVVDQLPPGVTFVSSPDNCEDDDMDGEVRCHDPSNTEDISPLQTLTKTITVQLDAGAPTGTIQNAATVNSFITLNDPDEDNNDDFVVTTVEDNVADLEIEKSSEVITTGGTSGVIDVRVTQSSDDAEEKDDDTYFGDDDLDINEKDYIGLRFQDIQIPQGATITNAYVKFTVEDENGDTGNAEVEIYGQDSDDTLTFTNNDNDISSRPSTTANIEWDIPNWLNEDDSGPAQTTPDLSSIIQEIVDRNGWASGNSMVIILEEDKGSKDRDAKAYDLDPQKSPLLHIEFDNDDAITEVIYTLTITNHGPGDATNVEVIDNLPAEVTVTNVVPVPECSIDGPQLVTCDFAQITSGSQQVVTIDTTLDPGTTGTIINEASVSGDQVDPDETNNEVSHETIIGGGELFCGRPITEFNVIDGTPNNDVLIGTSDDDLIRGFGGNDFINAKKGNDCIFGGDGKDKILGGHDDDTIEGNDGKDRIYGGKGNDVIFGNEGHDRLMGGLGDDGISGGNGNDIIRGGPGDDRVSAGAGDDKVFGQSGEDSLSADSGNDKVFGGNGDDFINGGENYDFCKGGPGQDVITNCEAGDPNTGGGDTKQLTGTIRDFHEGHDDMEQGCGQNICSSVEPGIVQTTLGVDKKPVFNQDTVSTNGETNFNEWYRDVTNVNTSGEITIELDNTITPDPTVYTFESGPGFFPIDDDCELPCDPLFGNEGNSHNYHFTIEFHSSITFQEGQMFKFTGDDDVWVFIDNKLVIDLGGVHPQSSEEITSADLISLGLETGEEYDLDIFFAERQTVQSNFRIDTSMIMD